MSTPHDPFAFDAEFGDPNCVKSARDPNRRPDTRPEWQRDGRAADIPVTPAATPARSPMNSQRRDPAFTACPTLPPSGN